MHMELTDFIKGRIDYVIQYAGTDCDDWHRIKIELIRSFLNVHRKLFSRRHYVTKKHVLNSFDKEVIAYWLEKTGIELKPDPKKMHDPNWINNGKFSFKEINEKRKLLKELKKENAKR